MKKSARQSMGLSGISKSGVKTRIIASIAVFSALYTVFRLIPTFPLIGVPGASFPLSDILLPLYGVILGPYVGGFAVILGTFLSQALKGPGAFGFLGFLPATTNAVAVGFLIKRRWIPVAVLYIALLAAFLLNPLSSLLVQFPLGNSTFSFPFAWMHIVAFVVLLSPLGRKAAQWVETLKTANVAKGLAIMAFIGTMMQHLMGSLLFEVLLGQILRSMPADAYPRIWAAAFFLYPWERLTFIVFAVVIGTPLVRVVKKVLPFKA